MEKVFVIVGGIIDVKPLSKMYVTIKLSYPHKHNFNKIKLCGYTDKYNDSIIVHNKCKNLNITIFRRPKV